MCLRGHGSSLSSKTLTEKLSWPAGSGQDDRALGTNNGQEAQPDESKCQAQEETLRTYSKETFIYVGFRKDLSPFIFPDRLRMVHTDLQVEEAEAYIQFAALLTDPRPDLVDSAISPKMGVLPHHQ